MEEWYIGIRPAVGLHAKMIIRPEIMLKYINSAA